MLLDFQVPMLRVDKLVSLLKLAYRALSYGIALV